MKKRFLIILPAMIFFCALCAILPAPSSAAAKPGLILGGLHGFEADKSKLDNLYGGGATIPLDKNARLNLEGYTGQAKSVKDVPDGQLSKSTERLYMATVDYVLSSGGGGGSYLFAGGGFGYEKLKYEYQREKRSISGSSVVTDAGFVLRLTKGMSIMARYLMFVGGKNLRSAATLSLVFH